MNGVDYTKQLAKDREYLRDAVQKTTEAAEKRIADNNKRNEHVQTKQRETYIKDRAELENNFQKNIDHLKEKTKDAIESSGNNYSDDLDKQRKDFEERAISNRNEFDQRLNDIKSSYDKSFKSERASHDHLQLNDKQRYEKNIAELSKKHHDETGNYGERMKDAGAVLKQQYDTERAQLVRSHEDNLTGVYKSERGKRDDLNHRIRHEIEQNRIAQEAELSQRNSYMTNKLSEMERIHSDRNSTMAQEYAQRNTELAKAQKQQSIQTNRDHQQKITEMDRNFNKELRELDDEKRRRSHGSEEFKNVTEKQRGLSALAEKETRIRNLKSQISDAKREYQIRANEEQDLYQQNMKTQSADFAAQLERKEAQVNAEKIVTVAKEKEKALHKVESREKQNRVEREQFEKNLAMEIKNSKNKLNNLKEHFNKSMIALEDKMHTSMNELNKVSKKDKEEFVKQTNLRNREDLFSMRRELSKAMDATVEGYEAKVAQLLKENEQLKTTMDQKVSDTINSSNRKLESLQTMYEEQRVAELNNQKLAMDQREHKLKTDTNSIIVNFQKKLDKLQSNNDSKLKLLTNDYENKLKELTVRTSREAAQKEATQKIERERLKGAFEEEKARLISTYESQIEGMKKGHEEQMSEMKNFKKLS